MKIITFPVAGVLALGAVLVCAGLASAAEVTRPKAVVELFTSQGCHSCPPADKILGKFAKEEEILGLSRHVDYWDYLGWKDKFASPSNTELQYSYARALKERQVYTPQAVINGRRHAVGSDENGIRSSVSGMDVAGQGMVVPINVEIGDDSIKIRIEDTPEARDATLYMVYFDSLKTIEIARGENAGKELSYHNVVQDTQALGMVKAEGLQMEFPIAELKRGGFDSCAFLLQTHTPNGDPSAIVGAAVLKGI